MKKTVYIGFGAALRPEGRAWHLEREGRVRRYPSLDAALRSIERETVRDMHVRLARLRAQIRKEFSWGAP